MSASFQFIPWVRRGAATAIRTTDKLGAGLPGRASLPVDMRINKRADAEVSVTIGLTGPGDITGLDARLVVRTDPPNLTNDFEPNYFPAVEFDPPDFPWLFTPAAGDPQGRLRPWISLIVVRMQDGVSLKVESTKPLPVLRITAPAVPALELPDPDESRAWAHAQVATSGPGKPMTDLLAAESPLNLSRLICPRRLEPGRRYLACVVPSFEAGRKAGLGLAVEPTDETALMPAWNVGPDAPGEVQLPVYYHWEFGTGQSGDFEALVRLLEARPIPPGVGVRPMIAANLPFGLPALGILGLEGALRPADFEPADPENMADFHARLREILNLPETRFSAPGEDPVVTPPIYGRSQTSISTVPGSEETPHWLRELNLDPRLRAIAGFGTLVVQDQQEQLMASAWEQLGDRRANQMLRQAQLAREVGDAMLGKHLKPLAVANPDRLFQITAPVHGRILMSSTTLLHGVRQSGIPARALSASFRRIVRPGGPLVRRLTPANRRQTVPLVKGLAVGQIQARIAAKPPSVTVPPAALQATMLQFTVASPIAMRFRQAAQAFQEYMNEARRLSGVPEPPVPTATAFNTMQIKLLAGLDPKVTFAKRVEEQIQRDPAAAPKVESASPPAADPLAEFTTAPQFPQPMYEALRDLSQDLLLPGLERIPPNTVSLLETNTRFVEAFMVGLNHEMSRELLWREFPAEQRASCFLRFWDDQGTSASGDASAQFDPVHLWPAERHLGENFKSGKSGEHLVLLIRGELLQRYPSASIYAVRAEHGNSRARRKLGQEERFPLFHGTLKPDVTFFGFPLTAEEALGTLDEKGKPATSGDPGWFFVIQQQPTEPRFGLDLPLPELFGTKPATAWNEVSWAHLVENETELKALTHAPVAGRLGGHEVGSVKWGFNAAHMAAATLQRPVRIAIHASALLEQRGPLQPEA